jgi:hypothetical protein
MRMDVVEALKVGAKELSSYKLNRPFYLLDDAITCANGPRGLFPIRYKLTKIEFLNKEVICYTKSFGSSEYILRYPDTLIIDAVEAKKILASEKSKRKSKK